MDTIARLFVYWQLAILILLPMALFALWVHHLERKKPQAYLILAVVAVAVYIVLVAARFYDGIAHRSLDRLAWLHLLGCASALFLLSGKLRPSRGPTSRN